MFCPNCGQERISEATSFCSRCGFLLKGTSELLAAGGAMPTLTTTGSPRSRGLKMGLFMILLTFVLAPIVGMITAFGFDMDPWPVGLVVFGLGVGGLLRIVYALMFESKHVLAEGQAAHPGFPAQPTAAELTAAPFTPPIRQDRWQTNDLAPPSVTDNTTKLLEKE